MQSENKIRMCHRAKAARSIIRELYILKKNNQQILGIISDKIEISNFQDTLDLMAGVIFLIGLSFFWIGRGVSKEEANVI